MKRFMILLAALLCMTLPAFAQPNYGNHGTDYDQEYNDPPQYNNYMLEQIEQRLTVLETLYLPGLNSADQIKALDLTDEIRGLLAEMTQSSYPQPGHGYGHYPRVMKQRDFEDFKQSVKKAFFADDQLKIVESVSEENYFNVNQVVEVLKLFFFADDQLDALEYMYPRCLNKRNSFKILDVFFFGSDKEKAEKIMEDEGD